MIGIFGLEMRTIKVSKKMIDFYILKRFFKLWQPGAKSLSFDNMLWNLFRFYSIINSLWFYFFQVIKQ